MKILKIIALLVSSLVFLCCARTYLLTIYKDKPTKFCHQKEADGYIYADDLRWQRFKTSLEFETVSYSNGDYNREELKKFQAFLIESKLSFGICVLWNKCIMITSFLLQVIQEFFHLLLSAMIK